MSIAVLDLPTTSLSETSLSDLPIIPHRVHEFGIEARFPEGSWEAAFNGPIQVWTDADGQRTHAVTVRLARMKDPVTRELYSEIFLFYVPDSEMRGMHNVADMMRRFTYTQITGPRKPAPICPPRPGDLWYDANPEGIIMEDVRLAPVTLPDGFPGFFATGQGYRGKLVLPDEEFIHDVGVYGGYLDPRERPETLELTHLFGGLEFMTRRPGTQEDMFLTALGCDLWVRGIVGTLPHELHVESYKNSVRLPERDHGRTRIGARSMSETKLLPYFESQQEDGLHGYSLCGFIDGLPNAIGSEVWPFIHRVGLGSNFVPCPELGGFLGLIHVVLDRNNPDFPETADPKHPDIEEQYEGWFVWLTYEGPEGVPTVKACRRALTPDDVPRCYHGLGELFDTKRVAFPISLYREGDTLQVGYGWGDRADFLAAFDYRTVLDALSV